MSTLPYGIETASFVAPRIWSSIPRSYKECSSVNEFKAKLQFWYPEICPCKLCRNYIYQIGYTYNRLPVIVWCFCYLWELVQRSQSGIQSVLKYLLIGASLLWKPVNRFALWIGWLPSLWCVKCGDFVWFLGGEFFVGRTVSAYFWSSC